MGSATYIQLPPDGTGKKVSTLVMYEVPYVSATGTFNVGDEVTGATSGFIGHLLEVDAHSGTEGNLVVFKDHASPEGVIGYVVGENLQVEGVTIAVCDATINQDDQINVNQTTLVSAANPTYGQDVDVRGAAFTRFYEGSPQFDAFGKLRTSQETILGSYRHTADDNGEEFATTLAGGGAITWLPQEGGLRISVDSASGSLVHRFTHKYHNYLIGQSHFIEMTLAHGDTGKMNNMRMWGYMDDDDGVMFRLMGTTLAVGLRSSVTGSVVNTWVNQADWSDDKLDGEGFSGMTLDVTKDNIYWIDLQWLGAGRVRFGVFGEDGERIVCHTWENANKNLSSFMRTGSLPLHIHVENTGVTASGSEVRFYAGAVKTEGEYLPRHHDFGYSFPQFSAVGTSEQVLFTMRAKQVFNTLDNRSYAIPVEISLHTTADIHLQFVLHPTLTAPTWAVDPEDESICEFDTGASGRTGGHEIGHHFFEAGAHEYDIMEHFDYLRGSYIHRGGDITDEHITLSVIAKAMTGTADINMAINWQEVKQ